MKQLVVNADDLGICEATNDAIALAHHGGVLTSASILVNGPAFDHALGVVRECPSLGVGLHLCLTSGPSVLPRARIPDLVDHRGCFRRNFLSILYLSLTKRGYAQIGDELTAQFRKAADAGLRIDHVNGHQYIHAIPAIHAITQELALAHGCRAIRRPREAISIAARCGSLSSARTAFRNFPKHMLLSALLAFQERRPATLRSPDHFFGLLDSGRIDIAALFAIIRQLKNGVTEVVTHPGMASPQLSDVWCAADRVFVQSPSRRCELDALIDPGVVQELESSGVRLATFRDVAN